MAGISNKAMLAVAIKTKYLFNGKELQQQEFSDGSGLEEYDYKYRFYDQQLGVFHSQDRLAEKFSYMSPYQFCSNNPIWLREIDGLEGVKYTETEKNGEKKTIVEKNVVVLTKKTKEIPKNASKKNNR
jgi:RHS repeat-associated protein